MSFLKPHIKKHYLGLFILCTHLFQWIIFSSVETWGIIPFWQSLLNINKGNYASQFSGFFIQK